MPPITMAGYRTARLERRSNDARAPADALRRCDLRAAEAAAEAAPERPGARVPCAASKLKNRCLRGVVCGTSLAADCTDCWWSCAKCRWWPLASVGCRSRCCCALRVPTLRPCCPSDLSSNDCIAPKRPKRERVCVCVRVSFVSPFAVPVSAFLSPLLCLCLCPCLR